MTLGVIPPTGRVLGMDWGTSRIGVAISDETQLIASPLDTLTRRTGRRLPVGRFLTLVEREQPVGLLVGVPLDDDGLEGVAAIAAREMGRALAARSGLPLDWIDESFSTVEAEEVLLAADVSRAKRKQVIDKMAAAVILQRWLDARPRPGQEIAEKP